MSILRNAWLWPVGVCALLAGATPAVGQPWESGVLMSPNGDWVVGTNRGGPGEWRTGVWDRHTNQLILKLDPGSLSNGAAFSTDSKKLAHIAYTDKGLQLRISELPGGKELTALAVKRGKVVAFSAGDTFLVTRDSSGVGPKAAARVVLWNLADGTERAAWAYRRLNTSTDGFVLSPDRKTLALLGAGDGALKLIDLVAAKELSTPNLPDVERVAYQPDGGRLVIYTQSKYDPKIPLMRHFVLLDAVTGKELSRCKTDVSCQSMALSADGKTLAVWGTGSLLGRDKEMQLWNTADWKRERIWEETRAPVSQLTFSPDGRWLAFHLAHEFRGGFGPRHESAPHVVLRELASGRDRAAFASNTTSCDGLTFAAGGKALIIHRHEDTQIADLTPLAHAAPLEGRHDGPVMAVACSPDGKTLASAGFDRVIRLWDPASGQLRATLLGHRGGVLALGFSPDGKTLASASADKTVRLWDPATGKTRTVLKGHAASVWALSFSKDGLLATGAFDGIVKLWDVDKGQEKDSFRMPGQMGFDKVERFPPIGALAFAPDGRRLAFTDGDPFNPPIATLYLYDVGKRSSRVASRVTPTERQPYICGRALLWGPGGRTIFCGPPLNVTAWNVDYLRVERGFGGGLSLALEDRALVIGQGDQKGWWPGGTVWLTDPLTGAGLSDVLPLPSPAMSLAGLGGGRIAIGCFDGSVVLWTIPQTEALDTFRKRLTRDQMMFSVAFSPDGKTLASGSGDGTVDLWDVETRKTRAAFKGHTTWTVSVAFSPDGKTLASGSHDKTIKLWDVAMGKEQAALEGHTDKVQFVAYSRDGKTLGSASNDKTVKVWDAETGKERATLKGHTNIVQAVAFSPDGKTLASASEDATVKLWDVETGKERATTNRMTHAKRAFGVAFSPDGKLVASASEDTTVKLWDAATGKELATLRGHTALVACVAFSGDGKTLASAGNDRTIKLWDVEGRKERATLVGHVDEVACVAFSPDNATLASASTDTTVKLWDVTTGKERAR